MRDPLEPESTLLASARQQEILRRVRVDKSVRVKDLAAEYGVHEMTIRRDLDQLADYGQIERIHGGARVNEKRAEELSYSYRSTQNIEAKERIARAAFDLIEDGDAVALDASTSSLALARLLPARRVNAFVTSLDAADVLATAEAPFVLIGGEFNATARSFAGALFQETLARLHPDKVFFSAKGYTPEDGFTDAHLSLAEVKIGLRRTGATMVALLDHTKFGRRSLATVARADEVDVVVTDVEPDPSIREAFERADVRVVVAAPQAGRADVAVSDGGPDGG
jgi:DeoR/GlpR family transcriptional regulator of sugar metabolism